jgi:signal transduction histidine kinase/ActR/RegA family two-component response regulator
MAKETILVVEDALDISALLKVYFTSQGYEVMTAMFGRTAIDICRKTPPNLVLLDINLPDMRGIEIGKWLRSRVRTRLIPIIIVSGRGEKLDRLEGLGGEVQAEYYIVKPFDIEELHIIVDSALRRYRNKGVMHPVTNLPTGEIINGQYHELVSCSSWATALVYINGLETYTQVYGASCTEDVLKYTASMLSEIINELGTVDDFIGQMVIGSYYVIITKPDNLKTIVTKFCERFDAEIGLMYKYKDRRNGYIIVNDTADKARQVPIMSLSIGVLTNDDGPFNDIRELREVIEETCRYALVEARQQGRKSHVCYGRHLKSVSVGGTPTQVVAPRPVARPILAADPIRKVLQEYAGHTDNAFLILQVETAPDIAQALYKGDIIRLSHARLVISLGDTGTLAILPPAMVGPTLDDLLDRFETHPLVLQHAARISYGYANGPFPSLDELIAAVANDYIERFSPADDSAIDNLPIFQLEPERLALQQRQEQARKLCDAYRKDLGAQRVGIDPQVKADIDRLTAVVDHDLGSGLGSLKAAIDQALDQTAQSVKHERDSLAWMQRQVVLCNLWKQSIAELGTDHVLQLRTIDVKSWTHTNFLLLCLQLNPAISLDTSAVSPILRAQVDPASLFVACLHMLLAAGQAGAHSLWIESMEETKGFSLTFRDYGEAWQRYYALQSDISLSRYEKLPWLYQNLSLVRRILDQQHITLSCRVIANAFQMIWTFPELPANSSTTVLPLHELSTQVEQLDREVVELAAQLRTVTKQSDTQQPEHLRQVLLPFVHELLECLRSLSEHADKLKQAHRAKDPAVWRVQTLSLYCYLLVRNLALVLEGEILPVENVNINDQVRQVIDLLHHKLVNVEVKLDLFPELPLVAIAVVEIQQVLMNLVKNAAEAISDRGCLSIRTTKQDGNITIRITDTGSGIPPEDRDKIFQLNFSTKGKGANSGVGLYAVQSIIQRAGGKIKVASRASQAVSWENGFGSLEGLDLEPTGTIFQIELPIAKFKKLEPLAKEANNRNAGKRWRRHRQ